LNTNLVLTIACERGAITVTQFDSVPVEEVCIQKNDYSVTASKLIKAHDGSVLNNKPGFSLALLLKIPVKANTFSMWFDEPRRVVFLKIQLLRVLHHPPP